MRPSDLDEMTFPDRQALRSWLWRHHDTHPGAWVRLPRRGTGAQSVSFEDLLAEGLAFGWSESTRRAGDESPYLQRFTPRRRPGTASSRNERIVGELVAEGMMTEAGLRALTLDPAAVDGWQRLVFDGLRLLTGVTGAEPFVEALRMHGRAALEKGRRPAHLTSSLLVLDESLTHVLLTHHRKARKWLQFGGHLEPTDASFAAAALREGREEAGLGLTGVSPVLVEANAHPLGPGFTVCREHLDVRFAIAVPREAPVVSDESLDVAWWPIDALPDPSSASVPNLIASARVALAH